MNGAKLNPSSTWTSLMMTSTGITALVLGEGASKAFTNLGGATMIRLMGAFLLVGGVMLFYGTWKDDEFWRAVSCIFTGLGTAIYCMGVVLGLHNQGLVSGQLSLCLAGLFAIHLLTVLRATRKKKE
jgi:hypothetical protein